MRLDDQYRGQLNAFGRELARQVRVTDRWQSEQPAAQLPV
jgi:hypothetical protein